MEFSHKKGINPRFDKASQNAVKINVRSYSILILTHGRLCAGFPVVTKDQTCNGLVQQCHWLCHEVWGSVSWAGTLSTCPVSCDIGVLCLVSLLVLSNKDKDLLEVVHFVSRDDDEHQEMQQGTISRSQVTSHVLQQQLKR